MANDTISRQAALDAIEQLDIPEDMCVFEILSHIELEIGTLPSAQPEVMAQMSTADCISRQTVLKLLHALPPEEAMTKAMLIQSVKQMGAAQPEQQWIPCGERLPDGAYPVIVTWKNTDPASYYQYILGKHYVGVAHYKNGKWYWYSSVTEDVLMEYGRYDSEEFDEAIECIAWMPLPECYRGENDGQ